MFVLPRETLALGSKDPKPSVLRYFIWIYAVLCIRLRFIYAFHVHVVAVLLVHLDAVVLTLLAQDPYLEEVHPAFTSWRRSLIHVPQSGCLHLPGV